MNELASYEMDRKRRLWLADLRAAEKKPRVLVHQPEPNVEEREECVICDKQTEHWLQPENAPLCSQDCLDEYLKDPSVYDPRGLHTLKVVVPPKPRRKRAKPKRWEPSEEDIAEMQDRIRSRREGKKPKGD